MANILDYVDWRGDVPLQVSPFNEVDNLLMAELSFLDLGGIVPPPELGDGIAMKEAAKEYFRRNEGREIDMGVLVPDKIPDLFCRMANSVRFGSMRLNGYEALTDEALEQQFAALTVELGDGSIYVAFRGTDDTLVGWKEDLNLGFMERIPSQERALRYLVRIARQYSREDLRIGGHSKGGNLAVYSALALPAATQRRIVAVYNNDGPGFLQDMTKQGGYRRVKQKILTLVPQSSVVGRLLEHEDEVQVVHSTASGVMQHDGFSWQVLGTQFVHLEDFSREGKLIDEILEEWSAQLTPHQREAFASAIYEVLTATGARTLSELRGEKLKNAVVLLKTYQDLDRETRQAISSTLRSLVEIGARNVAQDMHSSEVERRRRTGRGMKQKRA